jgi:serine/threonine protein kinase/Tol biopolymer transport system component
MTISAGTRLGPYEVLAPIGAGGMGEVYKAKDTRLDRTVAIKVLPSHLSASAEVRQRFEREAKTISQLSHPHICALYDVGNQDGVEYLVMEFLEGETLAERLVKGPLPADQTLKYGMEIADALDKAHRQGIVHRDLKPGNVMLTKSGVKLLDFGLAKAVASERPLDAAGREQTAASDHPLARNQLTALPTVASPLTQEGTILGTFQYMAPEQLEGKEADARTDIFALGSVLYEMATGKRAFSGASQASLIAAILEREPAPISTIQPMTPPALDRVVKTCLAKDPEDRFQTAHDVKLQLQWIVEGASAIGLPAPVAARLKGRERIAWILAAIASAAALGLAAYLLTHGEKPPRMVETSILPPEKSAFVFDSGPPALSPDGARLAFVAPTPDKNLLWVRALNGISAQSLAGTEGASFPFWSPDSRFLGFFAGGKLKKINASGGPPQTLCDALLGRGAAWTREGVIIFAPTPRAPLFRVSSAGGPAAQLTILDASRHEYSHRLPFFLPDGRHFLYLAQSIQQSADQKDSDVICSGSLDSSQRKLLVPVRSNAVYVPPAAGRSEGHLLFVRERTLVAQAFDAKKLRFTGEAVPVVEGVTSFANMAYAAFTASGNGHLAYQSGGAGRVSQLAWFDRSGKEIETVGPPADYTRPNLSHDGRRVAVDVGDPQTGNSDIWVIDLMRKTSTRLTFGPEQSSAPIWSPDDGRVVFSSSRNGVPDLFVKPSSGTGNEEQLFADSSAKSATDWSPDGRLVVFNSAGGTTKGGVDLWTISMADKKAQALFSTPARQALGNFSPDGHWLVYQSDESGRQEIYVQPFPPSGGKWQISNAGGREAIWSRDGNEIFYVTPDPNNKLMAVDVKTSPAFEAGTPKMLFEVRLKPVLGRRYSVSADGKRFLLNTAIGEVKSNPITLVLNWAAEVKR